jgi:hypothetical protein
VTVTGPTEARPANGLTVDFVVESDRAQLSEIVQRVRDARLRTNIGNVSTLDEAVAAFNPTERRNGKTIIRVRREDSGRASGSALPVDHRRLLDRGDRLRPATVARH